MKKINLSSANIMYSATHYPESGLYHVTTLDTNLSYLLFVNKHYLTVTYLGTNEAIDIINTQFANPDTILSRGLTNDISNLKPLKEVEQGIEKNFVLKLTETIIKSMK